MLNQFNPGILAFENLAAGASFALLRVLVLALVALEPLVQRLGRVANVAGCRAITSQSCKSWSSGTLPLDQAMAHR